jgi:hypothetical protein
VNKHGGTGANGKSDFMTKFDYDGDFKGRNNWDNLDSGTTPSHMYFSVTESTSHFFIYYMAYHPRDWCASSFCEEHENDAEGVVMLVRKDGTQFGKLEALVTSYHEFIRSYAAQSYIGRGASNPDTPQTIQMSLLSGLSHPLTYQEPEGHGFIGCTSSSNCVRADDGLRYTPSPIATVPALPPNGQQVSTFYSLLDLDELFSRRLDAPTFVNSRTMAGDSSGSCGDGLTDTCADNGADGIWTFGDERTSFDDNNLLGEDPATFFAGYFSFSSGNAPPSATYVTNRLLHQKCETGRRLQGTSDACVAQICAADSFCCNNSFDSICVGEVTSICGGQCTGCTANICTVQTVPIGNGCDGKCSKQICAVDPFCCQNSWDSFCVSEVTSVCGLGC